jgi:hypothetical protein
MLDRQRENIQAKQQDPSIEEQHFDDDEQRLIASRSWLAD